MRKTIHFRTVEWFGQVDDAAARIRTALTARPLVANTHFTFGQEHCEVRHRDDQNGDIFLHFTTYVVGARRGTAPQAVGDHNGDLGEATAPANTEFSEREVALVMRGDRVAFASLGQVQAKFVERCLRGLIELEHGADLANRLVLTAKADDDALERMLAEGISCLDLGLSLPHVEAVDQIDAQPDSIAGGISRSVLEALSARLTADHDEERIQALSNANARLVLKFRKNAPLDQIESLTAITRNAIDDDEEFKVRTRKGTDFSREQLLVRGHYHQPGAAHVLSYGLAWQEIVAFLDDLDA